jgi:thiamine biosynthesis lipoprotein ApbE
MAQERIEVRKNKAETGQQWFWHWIEANNKIIATSGEPFDDKWEAKRAAHNINNRLKTPVQIRLIEG